MRSFANPISRAPIKIVACNIGGSVSKGTGKTPIFDDIYAAFTRRMDP